MHISAQEEYGLRCALQLAQGHGSGQVSASQIAEREGISVEYVSKMMHILRKAGFVVASRGMQGGFSLARAPSDIRLGEILEAMKGKRDVGGEFCVQFAGRGHECVHIEQCSIRPVWQTLLSYFDRVLNELTLHDLLNPEAQIRSKVEQVASEKADRLIQTIKRKDSKTVKESLHEDVRA